MANKVVGSLLILLGMDSTGVKTGVDKAERHFKRAERSGRKAFGGITSSVKGTITQIGGLNTVLGALTVGGLSAFISSSITSIDQMKKFSDRLGISVEALSELRYAAELSGVTTRQLTLGMQRMTRRVAEAAQGMGEARGAIRELGLDAAKLAQLAPEDQFEVIADRLALVSDQSDRVRLAFKLFDSEGVGLLQMMGKGAAGLRQMREEARRLNITVGQDTAVAAEEAKNAFSRLKASGTALGVALVRELGPGIADIANWLSVNLPRAVDYAQGAFLGLKGVAEIVVGKISWLLGKWYAMFGLIPGSWGDQWEQMAKDFDAFAKFMEDRAMITASKIGQLQLFQATGPGAAPAPAGGGSGGSGAAGFPGVLGGTGGDEETGKLTSALERQLEIVREYTLAADELLFSKYAERQFVIEEAAEANIITEQQKYELLLALTAKYEKERTKETIKAQVERNRYTALLEAQGIKGTLRGLQVLTAGVARSNRALFEVNKAAAIGESIMNAYTAYNKALAQGGLFGVAAAVSIFATAMANVQAISQTSFGGGGSGFAASTPSTSTNPSGSGYVDYVPQDSQTTTEKEPQRQVNIYLSALGDEQVEDAVLRALERADEFDRADVRVYG